MFCSQCGTENSDDGKFCSKCGASLQEAQRHASSKQSTSHSKPLLWNPNAVANWSILFSPIFGSYLNARNWVELGEDKRAMSSKIWLYSGIIIMIICGFLPESIARGAGLWFLVIWYFTSGRKQTKYIKDKLNNEYQKKTWGKPILAGFGIIIGIILAFSIITFINDDYSTSQYNEDELYSQAFDIILDHDKRVNDYLSTELSDITDGTIAAKTYISDLIYKCKEGHISFTNSIYGLTAWQYKGLSLNGWNAPLPQDHESEYTKGIFSIPERLLDEQATMNSITNVAGFSYQFDEYNFYRFYNFGSDLTSNISDQWGPWVKIGQESQLGYPPRLDFKIYRESGSWTASPKPRNRSGLLSPLINEILFVEDVISSSPDAKIFMKDLSCIKYPVE